MKGETQLGWSALCSIPHLSLHSVCVCVCVCVCVRVLLDNETDGLLKIKQNKSGQQQSVKKRMI